MTIERSPRRRAGDDYEARLRDLEHFKAGLESAAPMRESIAEAAHKELRNRDAELAATLTKIEEALALQGRRQAYFMGAVGVLVSLLTLAAPVVLHRLGWT